MTHFGLTATTTLDGSTDVSGQINVTGTVINSKTITLTYSKPYDNARQSVILSAQNVSGNGGLTAGHYITTTKTSFTINFIGITGFANPNFSYIVVA